MSHWRERCKPIIAKVIAENKHLGEKVLRKALYNAYPFGERKMYPYKVWLSEISFQLGKKKTYWKKDEQQDENQIKMFED